MQIIFSQNSQLTDPKAFGRLTNIQRSAQSTGWSFPGQNPNTMVRGSTSPCLTCTPIISHIEINLQSWDQLKPLEDSSHLVSISILPKVSSTNYELSQCQNFNSEIDQLLKKCHLVFYYCLCCSFFVALKPAVMAAGGVTQNHLAASNLHAMLAPVADISYQYYPFVAILAGSWESGFAGFF